MTSILDTQTRTRLTAKAYARELRHSTRVRRLKVLLPVAAGMLLLAMIGRSAVLHYMQSGPVSIAGAMIENGRLIMESPRMGGLNAAKRRYEMTAARAIQTITDSTFVDLEQITAKLPVGTVDWAHVEAATGTMTKADNTLRITSPAIVKTTDGLVARLKSAKLDMGKGDLSSEEPVEIDTRTMTVTADRMDITEGGEVMVFEQRVKVLLNERRVDTAAVETQNVRN
jgi:lipopolysaccharide export system protein LptC